MRSLGMQVVGKTKQDRCKGTLGAYQGILKNYK